MNKVTTINLNGSAYQLEEAGYELMKKYLEQAKKKLAGDPDKDEILADFERAIAEKCDDRLRPRKNVITEKEVQKIIEDMGPVEPAEEPGRADTKSEPNEPPKRLYALRDGAIIGGVANGLAAYFNVDVTIVRLLFVLLVFVSAGTWILIYLLMMLILPVAQTPEQKAELRGERFSAQDVLQRAKNRYADLRSKEHWQKVAEESRPRLSGIGEVLQKLVRIVAMVAGIATGILLGLLTAAWISGLWWLAFGHLHLADQLATISLWTVAFGMTAAYLIAALPLAVLANLFVGIGACRPFANQSMRWLAAVAVLWVAAIGVAIGVAATTSGRVNDYQSTHGYIDLDGHNVCINSNFCPSDTPNVPVPLPPPAPLPYQYH